MPGYLKIQAFQNELYFAPAPNEFPVRLMEHSLHRPADSPAPLFTVVTVVYNAVNTIDRAAESVWRQTERNFEYIVVDGGSSDGTVAKIQARSDQINYWISEPDSGIYNAWNKALARARGQWISFLGADDQYAPDALQQYAHAIDANPWAEFVSSRVQLMQGERPTRIIGKPWTWKSFARYMTVAHVGAQHKRSLFDEAGNFDEDYKICGDYEFLLRFRSRLRALFINRVTAFMDSGGISASNAHLAFLETERAKRETAGRAPLLCAIERKDAQLRRLVRSLRQLGKNS
jgi:glycosyltransferase involved in cell wall biosynthesis